MKQPSSVCDATWKHKDYNKQWAQLFHFAVPAEMRSPILQPSLPSVIRVEDNGRKHNTNTTQDNATAT